MGGLNDLVACIISKFRATCSLHQKHSLAVPAGRQLSAGVFAFSEHSGPRVAQGQAVSAWTLRHRWRLWPDTEAVMRCNSSQGQTSAGDQQCLGPQRRTLQLILGNCLQTSALRTAD